MTTSSDDLSGRVGPEGRERSPAENVHLEIHDGESHILALHEEQIAISRRTVNAGIVRVAVVTQSRQEDISEELTHQRVDVEHVLVERYVDEVPPVRQHGDLTILSVVEEVLVVERRLLLREEIHIRRSRISETHTETVTLRKQEAVITRHPAAAQIVENDQIFPT